MLDFEAQWSYDVEHFLECMFGYAIKGTRLYGDMIKPSRIPWLKCQGMPGLLLKNPTATKDLSSCAGPLWE